ncbi:hypothetical protein [Erwinia tasmaniensis]|uniref:hypothetical protein n=1 Tax=Erwinia tasmaniensis TaxID=338565 RepID=UPI003A4D8C53
MFIHSAAGMKNASPVHVMHTTLLRKNSPHWHWRPASGVKNSIYRIFMHFPSTGSARPGLIDDNYWEVKGIRQDKKGFWAGKQRAGDKIRE